MVGAVIVHNGSIIGEGFHREYGKEHAEVMALNSVQDKSLLAQSVLYVNLEPCSHHGKTPPCADAVIASGIPKVVIGQTDPHDIVSGKGVAKLRAAGIEVIENVLHNECRHLNRRFNYQCEKHLPYVVLKWAQSGDGLMDVNRFGEKGSYAISGPESKRLVHLWRSQEMAILVGTNTALTDDPQLTVREVSGKNPVRILIDRELKVPRTARIYDDQAATIVFNARHTSVEDHLRFIQVPFDDEFLIHVLRQLADLNIQSVLVEGGSITLGEFIRHDIWNEARIITSSQFLGNGLKAPDWHKIPDTESRSGRDIIRTYFR
jgi:diaminohydroxyphosphoribosylaminopyrimidine deaminase/5-amino-6-(5-phosphoribosylamino)uracil reductase